MKRRPGPFEEVLATLTKIYNVNFFSAFPKGPDIILPGV